MLNRDFKEFAELLNSTGVEYLIVGGYALAAHLVFGFGSLGLSEADFMHRQCLVRAAARRGREHPRRRRAADRHLFAASGETFESVRSHIRAVEIEGVQVQVLDIDGLPKTKTDYREKDILDKRMLERIKRGLADG